MADTSTPTNQEVIDRQVIADLERLTHELGLAMRATSFSYSRLDKAELIDAVFEHICLVTTRLTLALQLHALGDIDGSQGVIRHAEKQLAWLKTILRT